LDGFGWAIHMKGDEEGPKAGVKRLLSAELKKQIAFRKFDRQFYSVRCVLEPSCS
jgi:hypothetical protein